MGKVKAESMGLSAPSRSPYMDIGRFRITAGVIPGRLWIRDMQSGEGGPFDVAKVEAALLRFWSEEF
jgi:hypothetical protein